MLAVPIDDLSQYRTLCLTYKLKVPKDFEFNLGGKLPGLYGTTGDTSLNSKCSGGDQPGPCYSARYMWRTDGDGEIYGYMPTPSSTVCNADNNICNPDFGQSLGRGKWSFPDDEAYHLYQQEITLNTGSNSDGSARVWMDGVLKMDQQDLQWRADDDIVHKGIFFNTFFGGGKSWGPSETMYLYFGDFEISTSCEPAEPSTTASPTMAPAEDATDAPTEQSTTPAPNSVCLLETVNTISGTTFDVKVEYTTEEEQDLRVSLFTTSTDYVSHTEVRVSAGSGTETVTVATKDFTGTGFQIKVSLEPPGKDFKSETAAEFYDPGVTGCSDSQDKPATISSNHMRTLPCVYVSLLLLFGLLFM